MTERETKGHGRTIIMSLIAVFFSGIAILWSWNTIAVDMFAQPEMEFRHAIAVVLLIIAAGSLQSLPGKIKRFSKV